MFGNTDRSQEGGQRREAVAELGFAEREPPAGQGIENQFVSDLGG